MQKRCLPLSGDLSSSIRPKCINLIALGEVGRGSHSVEQSQSRYVHEGMYWLPRLSSQRLPAAAREITDLLASLAISAP